MVRCGSQGTRLLRTRFLRIMKLQITRLPSEECIYSVATSGGKRYTVSDSELERWLLNLGVAGSIVESVLGIEPNQTTTLEAEKKAA